MTNRDNDNKSCAGEYSERQRNEVAAKSRTGEYSKRHRNEVAAELLAPAGDIGAFNAAIACGADAVYLGLSDFNARRKAENFNSENLRECVKRAHFFGVKVYITVNTLVKNSEFEALLSLVRTAVEARADAFIVQDLGVAACLKRAFPNIVLHASTQLGVHNLYGARQAEKFGFKRVVLSRETKLEDIRAICENTELEIEYFVQGALCVAFSGNCYLSAKECGASGNRGLCKQLCRLPYKAELDGKSAEGYLLSARDLCLADSVKELISAGVTSFKIEGRMRRESYVGSAVKIYRGILDGIKSGEDTSLTDDNVKDLSVAYSRGESYLKRAYLDEGTPSVIEKLYNNHTGIKAGFVKQIKRFKSDLYNVTVFSDIELKSGDGLKFFDKATLKEVASVGIGDVKKMGANLYEFVTKTQLKEGWQVNLISSRAQEDDIKNTVRKVGLDMAIYAVAGESLKIELCCNTADKPICIKVQGDVCDKAVNAPVDEETLITQLIKVGDSGFEVNKVRAVAKDAFVAKSAINALRRRAIEEMTNALISAREEDMAYANNDAISDICEKARGKFDVRYGTRLRFINDDSVKNGEGIITDIRELAVLRPSEYSAAAVRKMLGALGLAEDKVALQLPIIANGRDLAVIQKLLAELKGIKTLVSENIYGFEFASRGYRVIAGAGHNVYNSFAYEACRSMGASEVLPSIESGLNYADNEIPLMTLAHCPFKTLFDNDCAHCTYKAGLTLYRERRKYRVERVRVHSCYFLLLR